MLRMLAREGSETTSVISMLCRPATDLTILIVRSILAIRTIRTMRSSVGFAMSSLVVSKCNPRSPSEMTTMQKSKTFQLSLMYPMKVRALTLIDASRMKTVVQKLFKAASTFTSIGERPYPSRAISTVLSTITQRIALSNFGCDTTRKQQARSAPSGTRRAGLGCTERSCFIVSIHCDCDAVMRKWPSSRARMSACVLTSTPTRRLNSSMEPITIHETKKRAFTGAKSRSGAWP